MNYWTLFGQALVIGFSGAVAPGPLLTYCIQLTCQRGFWAGPLLILGHIILEALLVVGLIFGFGGIIKLPLTQIILGIVGGLLLVWMGWGLIWKETSSSLAISETAATTETLLEKKYQRQLSPILAGMLLSLSNPYWLLWWAMIGLALITQAQTLGVLGVGSFFTGHILADLLWYTFVSGVIATGRHWFNPQVYRWLLICCGIALILLASKFIFDALQLTGFFGERAVDLFVVPRKQM